MEIDAYKFTHKLRVRWSEVDSQKVVFNANYLNYFDIGVTEYYKAIGCPYLGPFKETNSDLFVKKTVVEYLSPLTYDDDFTIRIRTNRIGNSSIIFDSIIHLQKKIICTFEVVVINVSLDTKRPSSLPERLRNSLLKYDDLN